MENVFELLQVTPYTSNMKDVRLSIDVSSRNNIHNVHYIFIYIYLATNIRIQTSLLNGSDVTVLHEAPLAL